MKLMALQCPECGANLLPEDDHIVSPCPRCLDPIYIGEERLRKMTIIYAKPQQGVKIIERQPFWIFHGQVNITRRETQGGSKQSAKESAQLWGHPRYLYVPAWDTSAAMAQQLGADMAQRQPVFKQDRVSNDPPLIPVNISAADALKVAEFIVLAIEARRKDWMKKLDFTLEMESPELWALPASIDGIAALSE